jgi:hypothetical protein
LVLLGPPASAASLLPAGVLGNSGESGESLLLASKASGLSSGVATDGDLTLWLSGGAAVNRVALDGRLVERFPLEPPGSLIDSRTFAVVGGTLCFLGRLPSGERRLFALPMADQPNRTASALPIKLPERSRDWMPYVLAPQSLDGRLVLVADPKGLDGQLGVYLISPDDTGSDLQPAFTLPGEYPGGAAVDAERGIIYLGASFGLFVGGETHSDVYAITAVTPDGNLVPTDFPVACTKTPAIPTEFRGFISLAGDALWDAAWYGFVARLDLRGRGAPGRIIQWHHDLGYPTQIAGIAAQPASPQQLLCITTAGPDANYLAHWQTSTEQLTLVRRLGCLPTILSLGLSADGWVTVGTARTQLWWPWEAGPDAPPDKAELHIAVTPVHWEPDRCFSFAAQYNLDDLEKRNPVGTIFSPRAGDRNEARRVTDPIPLKRPIGLSVAAKPGDPNATLYVTDGDAKAVLRTSMWLPELKPDITKWELVPITGVELSSPADVAALTDGRLLVADAGRILLLELRDNAFAVAHTFERWGDAPSDRFGPGLRFAVDGPWMLISDTQRHRVVWLDWTSWTVLAQFGVTDAPGSDRTHLNSPTLVAVSGAKAVVADTGNQRVVKLELLP